MYKKLADEDLFNSKDIYDSIPEFKLNTDSFLIPNLKNFRRVKDEEEERIYSKLYIRNTRRFEQLQKCL